MQVRLRRRIVITVFGCLTVNGCVTAPPVATPEQVNEQQRMLAESSQRIADALAKVAIVEQAASGVYAQAITPEFVPPDLQLRVAVNYQGDVKPLVYQLAQTVGYEVKTYGRSSLLTPVNVHAEDRSIGELLADVGYQASWRCNVMVRPELRVIEIQYPTSKQRRKRRAS